MAIAWAITTKYLFWLLVSWLKTKVPEDSITWNILNVVGEELDLSKQAILDMRRESLIATASEDNLDKFGNEKGLARIAGETDEEYRIRLLSAYLIKKRGGTIPGMIEAVGFLGITATINEIYKTDPTRWAEFELIITGGDLEVLNQSIFYILVNNLKPAHTRIIIVLDLQLDEFDDGEIFDDNNYFDEFVSTP